MDTLARDVGTPMDEGDVSFDKQEATGGGVGGSGGAALKLGYQGWAARHLLQASHQIFVSEEPTDKRGEGAASLVAASLEHRGVIYWSLSNINADPAAADAATSSDEELQDEDVFHDGLTDFYHIWTLAEAFLLDTAPLPAAPLLRWLKMYSQSGEDEDARWELDEAERLALEAADAQAGGSAELTPAYWNALRSLVVGVMPRRAAEMLRSHPEGRDNASEVGALARQLEKMPLLLPERAGDGGAEVQLDRESFFETWTRWQKGCKAAASSFGFVAGAGGERGGDAFLAGGGGSGGGGEEERRCLRWLWGTLCGSRGCLEEATSSWSGLFAAVLAFERPDVRKEEVAAVMRECARKHPPHQEEDFLLNVIRDASAGAVESILRFASEHGDTLALSACAAHLVDLLFRAELPSVTIAQRSWFLRRLADRLKAFPCGGWEMAASYLGTEDRGESARLLRELTREVVPRSERAAHELVDWCVGNGLGQEAADAVCRARGATWIAKTGFSAAAMGVPSEVVEEQKDGGARMSRVPGACGKAAYWLAKGGGGIQLERLCAEVSERLMVEVGSGRVVSSDVETQEAVVEEAEGVLAAIPEGVDGPELYFLKRYKAIADLLVVEERERLREAGGYPTPHTYHAGICAVDMLAPPDGDGGVLAESTPPTPSAQLSCPPPPRVWAHLLRLALPALSTPGATGVGSGGRPQPEGSTIKRGAEAAISTAQVHVLLSKLQALVASEYRVGSHAGNRSSTLPSAPAPYGFRGGREEMLEIRRALATCLATTMMNENARETVRVKRAAGTRERGGVSWETKRLSAEALIAPRVAVGL